MSSNARRYFLIVTVLWVAISATMIVMSGVIKPPKQREEWNLTQFKTAIIHGMVSNGELTDDQFVGQTKKGVEFVVDLPRANDGQANWVNLLTDHGAVVRVKGSGLADMIGTMAISFVLPIALLLSFPAFLVALVLFVTQRRGGDR